MFGDYDEDLNDERQWCMHGTFIGSWWGPDYLCGLCEDGATLLVPVERTRWIVIVDGVSPRTGLPYHEEQSAYDEAAANVFASFANEIPNVTATVVCERRTEMVWVVPEDDPCGEGDEGDDEIII